MLSHTGAKVEEKVQREQDRNLPDGNMNVSHWGRKLATKKKDQMLDQVRNLKISQSQKMREEDKEETGKKKRILNLIQIYRGKRKSMKKNCITIRK